MSGLTRFLGALGLVSASFGGPLGSGREEIHAYIFAFVHKGNKHLVHVELFLDNRSNQSQVGMLADPMLTIVFRLDVE